MKDTNYSQLWSDILTGKSFVFKTTDQGSIKRIKTDAQGNSRTENVYGVKEKVWETECTLYRPLITKFDGYSQMPRPKAVFDANKNKPVKATPLSGIELMKKVYGCSE